MIRILLFTQKAWNSKLHVGLQACLNSLEKIDEKDVAHVLNEMSSGNVVKQIGKIRLDDLKVCFQFLISLSFL